MSRIIMTVACATWCVALAWGFAGLHRYESTPGPDSPARVGASDRDAVPADGSRPRLILFAHPRCPCTAASVDELGRILAGSPVPIEVTVYLYRPRSASTKWADSRMARRLRAMPGIKIIDDPGGDGASRAGASTSGHLAFYSREGALIYSGGITTGRGRSGDHSGSDAVIRLLRGKDAPEARPVFGCPIRAPVNSEEGGSRG